MRALKTSLVLTAAIATLQACGQPAMTRTAMPAEAGVVRAASDADRIHARRLVWDKFVAEDVNVGIVDLYETANPRVYNYVCAYDQDLPGKREFCFYVAKGQVLLELESVSVLSRERESCHPIGAKAR